MNSKGFEFSFGWLFAIIVGAAVIALAIYATTSFIKTERQVEDSSKSVELGALLRELETGLEESGTQTISARVKTRISNTCSTTGSTVSERIFGVQSVKTSVSSGIGEEWNNDSIPLRSQSMYLFSNKTLEGKNFVILSQRFAYPYKVADLVIMWPDSEKYCFVNAPTNVENTLSSLKINGVNFSTSTSRCVTGSKKICFAQAGCDVSVSTAARAVTKQGKTVYFDKTDSALFYAAVFSDPDIYECEAVRLGKKAAILSEMYSEEARFGMAYGCSVDTLLPGLELLGRQLNATRGSRDLTEQLQATEELKRNNDALICPLF